MRDQSIAVTAPVHGLRLDPRDVMAIDDGAQDEDSALQLAQHVQGTGTHSKPQPVQSHVQQQQKPQLVHQPVWHWISAS